MRIELSTTYKHYLLAQEAVAEIYSLGFDKMQLGAAHEDADLEAVRRLKNDLHLRFSMHAPFPNPEGEEVNPRNPEEEKQLILQSIENAHGLGADPIVFHPGSFDREKMDMDRYYRLIGEFCDRASDYGLTMCIENKTVRSKFGKHPQELVKVIEKVGANNLKLCFDTSHARTVSDRPKEVGEIFEKVKEHVGAIHLVDTHSEDDDHLPPSFGKIPTEDIVSSCREIDYTGPMTFEVMHVSEDMVIKGHRFVREVLMEEILG